MAHDLRREDVVQEDDNLLIEAVSLLVQRQRETESWVAEQVGQAQERAAATERRYSELDARLAGIEDQIGRLARDLEPNRSDPAVDAKLARLREQVEDLRSGKDDRGEPPLVPARAVELPLSATDRAAVSAAPPPPPPAPAPSPLPTPTAPPPPRASTAAAQPRPAPTAASSSSSDSVWNLLGATPQDRFGLILIGIGLIAILYVVLTQLRLG